MIEGEPCYIKHESILPHLEMQPEWAAHKQTERNAHSPVTLSHPDVSESVKEGHYTGIKMGNHKMLEHQLLYSSILLQCLT